MNSDIQNTAGQKNRTASAPDAEETSETVFAEKGIYRNTDAR